MSLRFNPITGSFNIAGASTSELTALEDKYVRTTRFEIINSGTSGSVTLPASSAVVLDDFGGTVDAVVAQVSGGKPLIQPAKTALEVIVASSFDASGNWVFTGTPSAYPVAILYRVRQKLVNFDSTSTNIWGNSVVDNSPVQSVAGRIGNVVLTSDDVGLGNVPDLDTSTTANITDSTDKRFMSDAQEDKLDDLVYKSMPSSTPQTTTVITAADITGIYFDILANEVWNFDISIQNGCNNTGGLKYAVTFPAAATFRAQTIGTGPGIANLTGAVLTASGTLSGVAFNTVSSQGGWCRISGTIHNSTNAGAVQVQFASGVDTQTSTIHAVQLEARRTA